MSSEITKEVQISTAFVKQLIEQHLDSINFLHDRDQVTKMTIGTATMGKDPNGNSVEVFPVSVSFKKEMEVRVIPLND